MPIFDFHLSLEVPKILLFFLHEIMQPSGITCYFFQGGDGNEDRTYRS